MNNILSKACAVASLSVLLLTFAITGCGEADVASDRPSRGCIPQSATDEPIAKPDPGKPKRNKIQSLGNENQSRRNFGG